MWCKFDLMNFRAKIKRKFDNKNEFW
jgi:hypothetical protein